MDTLRQQLSSISFSALELAEVSKWNSAIIEDYLSIVDNVDKIADYIDTTTVSKVETKTANFTTVPTTGTILADGTTNTVNISLDAIPRDSQRHTVKCINATFAVQLLPNGNNVDGSLLAIPLVLNQSVTVVFSGGAWWIV